MKTNAPVKKVLRSLRPYLPLLLAAVVSALISVSLTLYIPVLIGHAIDRIIGQGQVFFADVAQILGYIGIAVGGVTVFQWLMQYFVNLVCYKTVRDLRRAVFRKLNTVPLSYIDTHAHGAPTRTATSSAALSMTWTRSATVSHSSFCSSLPVSSRSSARSFLC